MPVLSGPGCVATSACPTVAFPTTPALCTCDLTVGGINDLYFIPCTETLSAENVADVAWWTSTIALPEFGQIGVGLGSIAKKADTKARVGSCRIEQITSTTWALKYIIKCFDKTSAATTVDQANALIHNFNKFLLVARMCDGDDTVLPVGQFTTSDFNWVVPDNFEEYQQIELELSWKELAMPKVYSVAGLSAVLPKTL